MPMRKLFMICIAVIFTSCSQEIARQETTATIPTSVTTDDIYIDKHVTQISINDAKKIASLMNAWKDGANPLTRSANSSQADIITITDSLSGTPLLYIINFSNDNGFIVLSATKKSQPVLAFSDKGHFSQEASVNGAKEYIQGYKAFVKDAINGDSDSLRRKNALRWALFEKADKPFATRGLPATEIKDLQAEIEKEIARKVALGYTYIGTITAAQYYLSAEQYQALIKDISLHTIPGYDYKQTSLLFIKSVQPTCIGPLLKTNWQQSTEPFNIDAANGFAGCVPIAMAQIVYYHKFPNKYDWANIAINPVTNEATTFFFKDIRKLCKVKYNKGGTSSNIAKAKNAFKELGYTVTEGGVPASYRLSREIKDLCPVQIFGKNNSSGHSWVCDGYLNRYIEGVISFLSTEPSIQGTPFSDYDVQLDHPYASEDESGEFFHMNLGWNGYNNGWYRANTYNPNSKYNYTDNQQTLFVQK